MMLRDYDDYNNGYYDYDAGFFRNLKPVHKFKVGDRVVYKSYKSAAFKDRWLRPEHIGKRGVVTELISSHGIAVKVDISGEALYGYGYEGFILESDFDANYKAVKALREQAAALGYSIVKD